MSKTSHEVPQIGTVFITKKRGQRTMRLRVDNKGAVQVSMPWMVPKQQAINFVLSKRDWILEQQASFEFRPYNGMLFGKTLRLLIRENSPSARAKQVGSDVIVPVPGTFDPFDFAQIDKIKKAMMKALRTEAEIVLLPRLREFALLYGFRYTSASIKQVTGRWGSCDSRQHISLSLYLIQLPIELIDYVMIHELAHTQQMNHSSAFWKIVEQFCPDYKDIRKRMRGMQPKIYDAKAFMA